MRETHPCSGPSPQGPPLATSAPGSEDLAGSGFLTGPAQKVGFLFGALLATWLLALPGTAESLWKQGPWGLSVLFGEEEVEDWVVLPKHLICPRVGGLPNQQQEVGCSVCLFVCCFERLLNALHCARNG